MEHIRDAVPDDMPLLADIYCRARASTACYALEDAMSPAQMEELIMGEVVLVAEWKGQVAGFVSVWAPERFVHSLYVDPLFQGRGLGDALLGACVNRFGLPLGLKCDKRNVQALRFYHKRGWTAAADGLGDVGLWDYLRLKSADAE